jgi:hypothetical protein
LTPPGAEKAPLDPCFNSFDHKSGNISYSNASGIHTRPSPAQHDFNDPKSGNISYSNASDIHIQPSPGITTQTPAITAKNITTAGRQEFCPAPKRSYAANISGPTEANLRAEGLSPPSNMPTLLPEAQNLARAACGSPGMRLPHLLEQASEVDRVPRPPKQPKGASSIGLSATSAAWPQAPSHQPNEPRQQQQPPTQT